MRWRNPKSTESTASCVFPGRFPCHFSCILFVLPAFSSVSPPKSTTSKQNRPVSLFQYLRYENSSCRRRKPTGNRRKSHHGKPKISFKNEYLIKNLQNSFKSYQNLQNQTFAKSQIKSNQRITSESQQFECYQPLVNLNQNQPAKVLYFQHIQQPSRKKSICRPFVVQCPVAEILFWSGRPIFHFLFLCCDTGYDTIFFHETP